MKTRPDFVSNSSSCSFVVEEPAKMLKFIAEELGGKKFYDAMKMSNASIVVNEADEAVLSKVVEDSARIFRWDGTSMVSAPLPYLENLNDEDLAKVSSLTLECDNYDTEDVAMLSLFKLALNNRGIKVDEAASEFDLLFTGKDNSVLSALCKAAFGSK